jgi:hypothetical protein
MAEPFRAARLLILAAILIPKITAGGFLMFRRSVIGFVVLLVFGGFLAAETYKGKLEKIDPDKGTGLIRDDKGPHPFKVTTGTTKIVDADGKEIKDGLKGFKIGDQVSVTTEGKGKKAMTKEIKREKPSE